jgi:hypothetical protein
MAVQTPVQTLTYRCPHCGIPVEVDATAEGSLLTCPAVGCGKPFRVALPVAEPITQPMSVVTPAGMVPLSTSSPEQPAIPQPAAQATAPPAVAPAAAQPAPIHIAPTPAVPVTEQETPGPIIHLSMARRYPLRCFAYLLVEAIGLTGIILGVMWRWHWLTILGGAQMAFFAIRFLVWWIRMSRITLALTSKRLILTTGVFSRDRTEIDLSDVVDSHFHQSLLMRWLDVGDLAIVSKPDNRQLVIMAVPHPGSVSQHLQSAIEMHKKVEEVEKTPATR